MRRVRTMAEKALGTLMLAGIVLVGGGPDEAEAQSTGFLTVPTKTISDNELWHPANSLTYNFSTNATGTAYMVVFPASSATVTSLEDFVGSSDLSVYTLSTGNMQMTVDDLWPNTSYDVYFGFEQSNFVSQKFTATTDKTIISDFQVTTESIGETSAYIRYRADSTDLIRMIVIPSGCRAPTVQEVLNASHPDTAVVATDLEYTGLEEAYEISGLSPSTQYDAYYALQYSDVVSEAVTFTTLAAADTTPTPTPTPSSPTCEPAEEPTPTPTPTPTPPTDEATPTPTPTATPTATPEPSPSPSPSPSASPSPSPSPSPVPSASPSPSPSPSASPSPAATPTLKTFAIEDNELLIIGSGASAGFVELVELDEDGLVEHVSDMPTTEDVGIPSFSFDLISENIDPGSYEFTVGVIFDKENSQSRLETRITRLILDVANDGKVTGRIPASSNALRVIGRNGSGAVTVTMNIANAADNGPIRLDGGTVTFDADYLIERISNSNAGFRDVILEQFDQTASYGYLIAVDQTAGTPVHFSHVDGLAGYTTLPKLMTTCSTSRCEPSADAFELNSSELAASFADAYVVYGSFNVVPFSPGSGGGGGGDDTGGPGGGFPPLPDDLEDLLGDLDDLLEDLDFDQFTPPTTEQLERLEEAFGNLEEQLADAQEQLASGTLSVTAGFSLLNTAGQTFVVGGNAAELGGNFDVGAAAGTLGGFAAVIDGMLSGSTPLTQNQINDIVDFTETKLESAAKMISNNTPPADVEKMMESTAELLNKTLDAGGTLSEELITAAVQVAFKAVSNIAGDVVTKLGLGDGFDVNNQAQVQQLLRSQPAALTQTLNNTPSVSSRTPIDANAALNNLGNSGIDAQAADRIVAALGTITNPSGVALPGGETATSKLLTALARAFGGGAVNGVLEGGLNLFNATGFAVDVDAVTGALTVRAGSESYAATSTAVRLVPSSIPEGVSYLADGRAVAVADGVAIELAPAAVDVLGFAAAVERAGFPATLRSNGSVALALPGNQRFSGTFAYDNLGGVSSACGAITFSNPAGAVNAANYAFTMTCANGVKQRLLPFVDNAAFYSTVVNAGLTVSTDRNTGAVTIGNVGRFKPSFFVNPLSTADQAFLTQSGTNGFAFRSRDLNGDGRADYEIISASGVQAMYAMP